VRTSIASSLNNFRVSPTAVSSGAYIDCLLLHSPLPTLAQTLEAWRVCESYVPHSIRCLGISNVSLPVLNALWDQASVKPAVVQNRFYAATAYDGQLRAFCRSKGIVFQSFWTLTANPGLMKSRPVKALAEELEAEQAVALYVLVLGLESTAVLDGTTNARRMKADLEGIDKAEWWIQQNTLRWKQLLMEFKSIVGDARD
jgi:diketogulonate reductase-like aldo/keto reductase